MSRSQYTYQTTTTLNVSQDYESPELSSPPPPEQQPPPVVPRQDTELVEDSLNANALTIANDTDIVEDSVENRGDVAFTEQVNRLSQQAPQDYDELYSLTPDRPRSQKHPNVAQQPEPQPKRSNNPLAALLTRGATVHKAVRTPAGTKRPAPVDREAEEVLQRSQGERSARVAGSAPKSARGKRRSVKGFARSAAEETEGENKQQSADDDVDAPVGSHPHSSKKTKSSASRKVAAPTPPSKGGKKASKSASANPAGALAALRMRSGQEVRTTAKNVEQTSAKPVLQPRDANVQTPAAVSKEGTKQIQAGPVPSAKGKLPPVRNGLLSQTPMGGPSKAGHKPASASAKTKMNGSAGLPMNESRKVSEPSSKPAQATQEKGGALKRPAKAMQQMTTKQDSTFDLPSASEDDEDECKPTKQPRKGKSAPRKRVAANHTTARSSPPGKKTARKSQAKARKPSPEPDGRSSANSTGPSKSIRTRMKAESGTVATVAGAKKVGGASKQVGADFEPSTRPDFAARDGPGSAQGKQAFSDQPDIDGVDDPAADHDFDPPMPHDDLVTIKKEEMGAETSVEELEGPIETARGNSQANAIELSDAQPSSDDDNPPARANRLSGTQEPVERPKVTRQQPHTPAILRSSPPLAGGASTKPTTAGLVDPQSARKSTIISFDKSGPRNQGTGSARPSRPSLAPDSRSSLPPINADIGGATIPREKRRAPASSAVKSSKSFTKDISAAPSNVAADAREALAALKRQSLAPSQPSSNHMAIAAHTSRYKTATFQGHEEYNDGYANVDQFVDDTTFIGDVQDPEPEPEPAGLLRTLSQVQMPPPMSRKEQKMSINRAPTVPSMMRPQNGDVRLQSETVSKPGALGKRQQFEETAAPGKPSKRARIDQQASSMPIKPESQDSSLETTVMQRKPTGPHRTNGMAPQRGGQRQTRRQNSQGTVDMQGSPVPKGMVVGEHNTVLQTFSQQAPISSDHVDADGRRLTNDLDIGKSDLLTVKSAQKQPARLSGNTKALPAEPSQESQAITHVARVPAGRRPFVTADQSAHPPTDPFTSIEEEAGRPGKGSSTTTFSEHLRWQAARGAVATKAARCPPQDNGDDPDKTLVDEYDEEDPAPLKRQAKRTQSFSSVSSSDASTDADDADPTLRDLGLWRKALQPHQMNLFDELVTISHKLVRHLVDQEEATATAVDDYRRRGEALIENLQAGRAKDVQGHYAALKEKKKRLQREIEGCAGRLKDVADEVKAVRKEVRRRVAGAKNGRKEEVEQGLREVMDAFC